MIQNYKNRGTQDIAMNLLTKAARKVLPTALHQIARRKLFYLDSATSLQALGCFPGNKLERLRGDRTGTYSIRINDQYRICFRFEKENAFDVEIIDYH